ncbi:MAG: YraN family protein [Dehalococcoidia bacterium]
MTHRSKLGRFGEKVAGGYLRRHGYKVLQTNYRTRAGEIDIVAQKGEYLVFVEVRTKRDTDFGTPEESIRQSKKEKLAALAELYIQSHESYSSMPWRIDVVAVEVRQDGKVSRVELIENAV